MKLHPFAPKVMLATAVLIGCSDALTSPSSTPNPTDSRIITTATPPAENFVAGSDNPYFPLIPGTTYTYRLETDEGIETTVFTVTNQTKVVDGVTTIVVEDIVSLDGVIIEHTFDWFAQDTTTGDVWYFGEDVREFDPETGRLIGKTGSWEAGKKGAEAGIIMLGNPQGDEYEEEHAPGVAEDAARVVSLKAHARVPYGNFRNCLKTENFTPLEPDVLENKYYCPGVGLVLEVKEDERNELISKTP